MDPLFNFIDDHRDQFVQELLPFVAQPSVSATGEGMQDCAKLLAEIMGRIGIEAKILPTAENPIVYGEISSPVAAKTLLLLCHYDVVSPGPLENWAQPPFEPVIRENRIWGRGAGDDKGQLLACLKAVEAWKVVHGSLPVNVRLVFLGDEETGSISLPQAAEKYRDLFSADAVLFTDASTLDVWGPVIYLANRGVLAFELVARGAERPAHSGSYGALLRNPAVRLAQAIASMRDPQGRILIRGFYEGLRPIGEMERYLLDRLSLDAPQKLDSLGATEFWGDPGYGYFETQMYRPTLNVHGLTAGYQGSGWMAMVPSIARAKLDVNIVPDLDPDDLKRKVQAHLAEHGFTDVELVEVAREPYASEARLDDPFLQVVSAALQRVWGKPPVLYPSIGGGGGLVKAFKEQIGIPNFLMVPLGQPDMNEHSPHESLDIDWFIQGIKVVAAVIDGFAGEAGPSGKPI